MLGASVTQQQLVPALMRCYSQADFVVGLDVDKDTFDKFTMRHDIDLLLLELWRDAPCKEAIRKQAAAAGGGGGSRGGSEGGGGGGEVFSGFVAAVLNDLIYLFKDSLERLADIRQIEQSKADAKVSQGARV